MQKQKDLYIPVIKKVWIQVKPSGLVTDNQGMVIQLMFGEDGVDPAKSDFGKAADLNKIIDENRLGDANPNYDSGVEQEGK